MRRYALMWLREGLDQPPLPEAVTPRMPPKEANPGAIGPQIGYMGLSGAFRRGSLIVL